MTQHEVVITAAGARAVRDCEADEVMHPVAAPLHEAEQLYVGPSALRTRLESEPAAPLVLLDAGLGAGSNAIAAFHAAHAHAAASARPLEIISIDRTLGALALALQPDHAPHFGFEGTAAHAATTLLANHAYRDARVHWRLRLGDLLEALTLEPEVSVDIVFWDLYPARLNAALWTVRAFTELRRVCRAGATVHTYSGATATRLAMLLAGFAVGYGPGAGGVKQKNSTIGAVQHTSLARPLDRRWLENTQGARAAWPADASSDAITHLQHLPQFQTARF
ncbi:MAG: hypothetical protein RL701_7383 [Pseudomonadota bacterium]|jgi:queuine tRNA-ribosyltransferase